MTQALRHYLSIHQAAVNAVAVRISQSLAYPDETDRDARRLLSDARTALHGAIEAALDVGPTEGWRQGAAGEVVVVVRVPTRGQGNMGKIGISSARLDTSGMIPCPDDWPQDFPPPSGLVERLHSMIFPDPEGPRIVEADAGGRIDLGERNAGVTYVLTELAEGEIWLRTLEPAESGKR